MDADAATAAAATTPVCGGVAPPLTPTTPEERIALLDVVRGLALLGILVANMRGFAGPLTVYSRPRLLWGTPSDLWVQALVDTLIQGKFITLFAALFGIGFALQFARAEKRQGRFVGVYVRRLTGLLLFGALHQLLFWWGDILVTYALGGFLLIPFRRCRSRTILAWALALMFLPAAGAAGFVLYRHLRPPSPQKIEQQRKKAEEKRVRREREMRQTVKIYQQGSYAEVFRERLRELKHAGKLQPIALLSTLPIFLLGLWIWRQGILQEPTSQRALLRKGVIVGASLGIPANLAFAWAGPTVTAQWDAGTPSALMAVGFLLATVGRPALSACYGCGLILLFANGNWRRRMMPFAAVGRTALSNYLLQSVVCTTIFYGYGGGWFARISLAWLLAISIAVYALEAPLSAWWLKGHRFGPAEWAWRAMTYGRQQLHPSGAGPA